MSKRKNQIQQELAILKFELNSNYGIKVGKREKIMKVFDGIQKLKKELRLLNQKEDE